MERPSGSDRRWIRVSVGLKRQGRGRRPPGTTPVPARVALDEGRLRLCLGRRSHPVVTGRPNMRDNNGGQRQVDEGPSSGRENRSGHERYDRPRSCEDRCRTVSASTSVEVATAPVLRTSASGVVDGAPRVRGVVAPRRPHGPPTQTGAARIVRSQASPPSAGPAGRGAAAGTSPSPPTRPAGAASIVPGKWVLVGFVDDGAPVADLGLVLTLAGPILAVSRGAVAVAREGSVALP